MLKNRSQGFTLIELLVVIAIIGILSAVVLASLSTARSKGNDAAVQSNLSTVQTQAEIYYGSTGSNSYGSASQGWATPCPATANTLFSDSNIAKALTAADSANGAGTVPVGAVYCSSNGTNYIVGAALSTTNNWQCVDSTGVAKLETTAMPGTVPTGLLCP